MKKSLQWPIGIIICLGSTLNAQVQAHSSRVSLLKGIFIPAIECGFNYATLFLNLVSKNILLTGERKVPPTDWIINHKTNVLPHHKMI